MDILSSKENLVIDKGEYVILHLGGIPYEVPKEIYNKMQKNKK